MRCQVCGASCSDAVRCSLGTEAPFFVCLPCTVVSCRSCVFEADPASRSRAFGLSAWGSRAVARPSYIAPPGRGARRFDVYTWGKVVTENRDGCVACPSCGPETLVPADDFLRHVKEDCVFFRECPACSVPVVVQPLSMCLQDELYLPNSDPMVTRLNDYIGMHTVCFCHKPFCIDCDRQIDGTLILHYVDHHPQRLV